MKPFALSLILLVTACGTKEHFCRYADPFVGTAYTGHTFPGAAYPLGMMQPGPETGRHGWRYCSGYNYEDSLIYGFSQNRLNGTGCPDLGDIPIMPFSGEKKSDFRSRFSKATEKASPGYYAVELEDNHVGVEITTTPHVAFHNYHFRKENPSVYIDFQSGMVDNEAAYLRKVVAATVEFEDDRTISGHQSLRGWVGRGLYYVIHFSQPIVSKEQMHSERPCEAPAYVFEFAPEIRELQVKIAFSTVSVEGAKRNLEQELPHWDFTRTLRNTNAAWEKILSRIEIEGTDEQKRNFYTSLYHLFIQPNNIADVDGSYRNGKGDVVNTALGVHYSTLSLWDTYRAAHPLYTLLAPRQAADMVNSMLEYAETVGWLPMWSLWGKDNHCMIGNHAVPVVVDACIKGLPGVDSERAYATVKRTLTINHAKSDWTTYDKYGYYPFDLVPEESVSRTLETTYDDYCAAKLAELSGRESDAVFFKNRASNYKNLFDPENGLMRGRDSRGNWRTPFDPYALSHAGSAGGDYTEGNALQYTWHVQHDIEELAALMGGKERFIERLDRLFEDDRRSEERGFTGDVTGLIGQYAHGNEPSHHVIYLYKLMGQDWKTEELVREVFDRFYRPVPDGLCGNDDCGQMSAWYLFSAMGFYPVDPVSGQYVIGAPQVPRAVIRLPEDRSFTIVAHNLSPENKYVKSVSLNSKPLKSRTFSYDELVRGGCLEFEMTNTRNK